MIDVAYEWMRTDRALVIGYLLWLLVSSWLWVRGMKGKES